MRIIVEIPTWIGDSVMVTPALENLINNFSNSELTIIGSQESIQLFALHPRVNHSYVLNKEYKSLYKFAKKIGHFDVFISFRSSFRSKIFSKFISSGKKYQFKSRLYPSRHQVQKYNDFINECLNINFDAGPLKIYSAFDDAVNKNTKPLLGINPGASYGDAKRWYPDAFADVICELHEHYDTLIFGGPNEVDIAADIEKNLIFNRISNYKNLAGKTSIAELIEKISKLDLFITGDSGPMHIAASFNISTISIFGPTNDKETSQWMNRNGVILKKNLKCQPCMKRTCPLKHHNCMSLLESQEVLLAVKSLVKSHQN